MLLTCRSCQKLWDSEHPEASIVFLRFETSPVLNEHQENSVYDIAQAGAEIVSCPMCPIEDSTSTDQPRSAGGSSTGLNEDMYKGSNRRTAGDEDSPPPPASGGVTHGA